MPNFFYILLQKDFSASFLQYNPNFQEILRKEKLIEPLSSRMILQRPSPQAQKTKFPPLNPKRFSPHRKSLVTNKNWKNFYKQYFFKKKTRK